MLSIQPVRFLQLKQQDQLRLLRRELAGQEAALRELENDLFNETKRFEDTDARISDMQEEIAGIRRDGVELTKRLEELEKTIVSKNSNVASQFV